MLDETKLYPYFKSLLEMDTSEVVICNLEHEIIYMNPAAVKKNASRGGAALLGSNVLDCHNPDSRGNIQKALDWFRQSRENNIVYTGYREKSNKDFYMVALRDETGSLIGYYEKRAYRSRETGPLYDFGPQATE